jgi:hypothetical protein
VIGTSLFLAVYQEKLPGDDHFPKTVFGQEEFVAGVQVEDRFNLPIGLGTLDRTATHSL